MLRLATVFDRPLVTLMTIVPGVNASIDRFVAKALERNLTMTVVNHPAGSHGFEHKENDARTREILEMALAFFRAQLGAN